MAKLLRFCVLEEEHNGENVFKCHRPFIFGNPYIFDKNSKFKGLIKTSSLEECLDLYGKYFDKSLELNDEFREEWERLLDACKKYDVVYIGCYCPLNKPCHTDYIIKKAEQTLLKEHIQSLLKG